MGLLLQDDPSAVFVFCFFPAAPCQPLVAVVLKSAAGAVVVFNADLKNVVLEDVALEDGHAGASQACRSASLEDAMLEYRWLENRCHCLSLWCLGLFGRRLALLLQLADALYPLLSDLLEGCRDFFLGHQDALLLVRMQRSTIASERLPAVALRTEMDTLSFVQTVLNV